MGLDLQLASPEAAEHPPDHRGAEHDALPPHQHPQRPLPHPRILLTHRQDRRFLGRRPGRRAGAPGTPRTRLQAGQVGWVGALPPAVERRDRDGKRLGGLTDTGAGGMLDAEEAEPRLGTEGRRLGKAPLHPQRHPADDGEAPAKPTLPHPATVSLALLAHEGISWFLDRLSTTTIPGSTPSLHRCPVLTCF